MTLTEALEQYEADQGARTDGHIATLRRAYMAGALAALTSKAPREQLLAEVVQYGRTVGREIERTA